MQVKAHQIISARSGWYTCDASALKIPGAGIGGLPRYPKTVKLGSRTMKLVLVDKERVHMGAGNYCDDILAGIYHSEDQAVTLEIRNI